MNSLKKFSNKYLAISENQISYIMTLLVPGFSSLPEDKSIKTDSFLNSCDKIPGFFDLIGGAVFKPVKNDVQGNIEKIRKRFLQNPIQMATLKELILFEKQETDKKMKEKDGTGVATNALLWLCRGLEFIAFFLEHLVKNDYDEKNPENLKAAAQLAYSKSLKPFHGWLVGKIVTAATNACPYRTEFLKSVATGESVEADKVVEMMTVFLDNFKPHVDQAYALLNENGIETKAK